MQFAPVLVTAFLNTRRFTRSIIKSRAAMTYQEAQTRIDDERLNDEVTLGLRRMNAVAKVLRKRRAERWAEHHGDKGYIGVSCHQQVV